MIIEYYKNLEYMGQEVICKTELFDKEYYYLRDHDGTVYLTRIKEDGTPDFT